MKTETAELETSSLSLISPDRLPIERPHAPTPSTGAPAYVVSAGLRSYQPGDLPPNSVRDCLAHPPLDFDQRTKKQIQPEAARVKIDAAATKTQDNYKDKKRPPKAYGVRCIGKTKGSEPAGSGRYKVIDAKDCAAPTVLTISAMLTQRFRAGLNCAAPNGAGARRTRDVAFIFSHQAVRRALLFALRHLLVPGRYD